MPGPRPGPGVLHAAGGGTVASGELVGGEGAPPELRSALERIAAAPARVTSAPEGEPLLSMGGTPLIVRSGAVVHLSTKGGEVNLIDTPGYPDFLADAVISYRGLPGLILFKLALTLFVILMAEIIGRRKHKTGRSLAEWAVAISAIPIVVALGQLLIFTYSV